MIADSKTEDNTRVVLQSAVFPESEYAGAAKMKSDSDDHSPGRRQ
jgi:hypothetical protein